MWLVQGHFTRKWQSCVFKWDSLRVAKMGCHLLTTGNYKTPGQNSPKSSQIKLHRSICAMSLWGLLNWSKWNHHECRGSKQSPMWDIKCPFSQEGSAAQLAFGLPELEVHGCLAFSPMHYPVEQMVHKLVIFSEPSLMNCNPQERWLEQGQEVGPLSLHGEKKLT